MRRRIKIKNRTPDIGMMKVRSRYTVLFFAMVFPLFLITLFILHVLSINDIPVRPFTVAFICGMLCIILGYITSYLLMNTVYNPLEELNEASQKVAKGEYDVRLQYNGPIEELGNTFDNFNFMVEELSSVEIMRKDFIADVSHEFKTPLASIAGYVTLMQDCDLSEEEREEYFQMACLNINKLNDLTTNILQLSKLENQSSIEEPVTYRLDEQLRESIVLLEPKWSKKQLNLELNLPKTLYTGQQSLLSQVWTNLIGNAVKFSDENGVITVSIHSIENAVEVIISDEGIGMSEETLSHIFDKFYQGDSSRKAQGNGLGLALCKKIVDLCNGKIFVSSEPNKGSVFLIRLPRR